MVAALPLVSQRIGKLFRAGGLPSNEWAESGDLLIDPDCQADAALGLLAAELRRLPWPILCLDGIDVHAERWRQLLAAVDGAGFAADFRTWFETPRIETIEPPERLEASWSKSLRKSLRSSRRKAEAQGPLQYERHRNLSGTDVLPLLDKALQIEHRGWKGEAGTSILSSQSIGSFFRQQAQHLAVAGALELHFLHLAGRAVAFEYGMTGGGVFYSCKVSYDPQFAGLSPGQMLCAEVAKEMCRDPGVQSIDCMGPITGALARFRPATYQRGRLIIAPQRLLGEVLLYAYKYLWPQRRDSGSPLASSSAKKQPALT